MEKRIINYISLWSCIILLYINEDKDIKYAFITMSLIMLVKTFYDNIKSKNK